jgi:hypothetical protein
VQGPEFKPLYHQKEKQKKIYGPTHASKGQVGNEDFHPQ